MLVYDYITWLCNTGFHMIRATHSRSGMLRSANHTAVGGYCSLFADYGYKSRKKKKSDGWMEYRMKSTD